MEIKYGLIDRPNHWDAKPSIPYHMLGLAMVLTLWSVLGLAVVAFLRGDPEELSSRGQTFGLALIIMIVGFAWIFFLMHLRSLLLVRRLTRGMAHKRFTDMQPGEVIATIEEHLTKERVPYDRLSLIDALPKEYVPGSMHYIKEIIELRTSGTVFLVQPFYHGDDARGLPSNTPVYLGPLTDENWELVEGLMKTL